MRNKHRQECFKCSYLKKCWGKSVSTNNVILNILACRIKRNIHPNESTKLFLKMIKPAIVQLVEHAKERVGTGYIDTQVLITDLESRIIECLISEDGYQIGGPAYLTSYLFSNDPRMGWVRKWILWHFSKYNRFCKRHMLYGDNPESDTEEEISELDRDAILAAEAEQSVEPCSSNEVTINKIMEAINDGITLNANEYRVISFCMAHANESNQARLIDGIHIYLSEIMKVSRPRITRLYATSRSRILSFAKDQELSFT